MPPPATAFPGKGLYLLTPDEADTASLVRRVAAVLPHATLLQYRNKDADAALRREQALALLALCRAHGVPLVINDDWPLAAGIGADGVHLGEHDGMLQAARSALGPDAILGASCYDSLDRAADAARAGASYLAFGAFFPSSTKPNARQASMTLLRDAARFGLPLVAIGGITRDNTPRLVEAGADYVAVISGVFDAPDPIDAARGYAACFLHTLPLPTTEAGTGDNAP